MSELPGEQVSDRRPAAAVERHVVSTLTVNRRLHPLTLSGLVLHEAASHGLRRAVIDAPDTSLCAWMCSRHTRRMR